MSDDLKLIKALTSEKFYTDVDSLVKNHSLNYMDAVVYYCEKNDVEIETAAMMIRSNHRIKSYIQNEGEELNFLPRSAKLPI